MDQTQERLSTGKKVNSAIDNPSSYYTAQSLSNRASDLDSLLDSMGQGIQTIKAANEGIESITSFVQQAKAVANTARDTSCTNEAVSGKTFTKFDGNVKVKVGDEEFNIAVTSAGNADIASIAQAINGNGAAKAALTAAGLTLSGDAAGLKIVAADDAEKVSVSIQANDLSLSATFDPTARETSIKQYNEIIDQINQLANDASYKGVNLLKGDDLKVIFNEDRSSYIEVKGTDLTAAGLGLKEVDQTAWSTNNGVDDTISAIEAAVTRLRDVASEFGNNYSIGLTS